MTSEHVGASAPRQRRALRRARALTGIALATALGLLGCAGAEGPDEASGASSGGDIQLAQELVERYATAEVDWEGPTTPVETVPDKKLTVVTYTLTSVSNQRLLAGVEEAAELLDWEVEVVDSAGQPDKFAAGIDSGIAQQADGIVLVGSSVVPEALQRAADAGIPIIGAVDTKENPIAQSEAYVHLVSDPGDEIAAASAAQLVVDHGAGSKAITVGITQDDGDVLGQLLARGSAEVFEASDVEVAEHVEITAAELGTGTIGQKVVAAVQKNPDADAVWVSWDGAAIEVATALTNGSLDVPVYSTYADPQNLEIVRSGGIQKADVAVAVEWAGWAVVDNFLREFAGEPQEKFADDGVPFRLITPTNIEQVLPGDAESWEGEYDFRARYQELWGL